MRYFLSFTTLLACVTMGFLSAEDTSAAKPLQERTLLLVKPNAVADGNIGAILTRVEASGLRILGLKMQTLSLPQAESFYAEHQARPFFKDLTKFMSSGPLVAIAIEGPNAVSRVRSLLGSTNPKEAAPGTVRADFGSSVQENAAHGSDSEASAKRELLILFPELN